MPRSPEEELDPELGRVGSRSVARRFRTPDGWTILVGRSARDNDLLTLKLCGPRDFWFHLAGAPGSHVVVRNPESREALPRATELLAAGLAARFSKARNGGWVTVHACRGAEVRKRPGQPAGEVTLERFRTLRARPVDDATLAALAARSNPLPPGGGELQRPDA